MARLIRAENQFLKKRKRDEEARASPGQKSGGRPKSIEDAPPTPIRSRPSRWGPSLVETVLRACDAESGGNRRTSAEIIEQDEKSVRLKLRTRKLTQGNEPDGDGPDVA